MVTTAIVVCSAVAVVAIVIFLIALFNGSLLNKEKALVEVPYLVGDVYSDTLASQYPDFVIKLQQRYDDTSPKGTILHVEPTGGSKVVKGSDLWITVSLGQEPEAKTMDDFVGTSAEDAKSILGIFSIDLSRPIRMDIYSDDCDYLLKELDSYLVKDDEA